MSGVAVGQKAPPFRLPSAQGPEVALEDCLARGPAVLWFTKGMACGFCRHQMSQFARGYPRLRAAGAELLQVTPTPLDRGRVYARSFTLPFAYLCDPGRDVFRQYALDQRSHSVGWYLRALNAGRKTPEPPSDFGRVSIALKEFPRLVTDDDMGFFVVDRQGVIRYALAGAYAQMPGGGGIATRPVPSIEEILRELERLG